jgi:hypothetical protein
MADGAETPNIAALPAIARLGADRKATVQYPRLPAQIFVSNCSSMAMSIRLSPVIIRKTRSVDHQAGGSFENQLRQRLYLPRPVSSADLAIMRHLDRLHLEFPFAGSRMLRGLLALQGCKAAGM